MKTHALLLLLLPFAASAGMYKWTDKNGVVHYTQTPPPVGAPTGKVPKPPPATAPRTGVQKLSQANDAERKKQADETAKSGAGKDDRTKLCAKAQANLQQMATHSPSRLSTTDEQGNVSRVTADQYEQIRSESENDVRIYCN